MTTRPYRSAVREQGAASTRSAILDAAEGLFAEHGYARVTIGRIAQTAGVAPNTVYVAFGNKLGLIQGLAARASDDAVIQEALDAIEQAGDGDEIVRLAVRSTGRLVHRHARLMAVLTQNAAADPGIAATLRDAERLQRKRFGRIVARLAAVSTLRPGLTAESATDVLSYHLGPESWLRLDGLGWSAEAGTAWLEQQVGHAVLGAHSK